MIARSSRLSCTESTLNSTRTEWLRSGGFRGTGRSLGGFIVDKHLVPGLSFPQLSSERDAFRAMWLALCEINGVEP